MRPLTPVAAGYLLAAAIKESPRPQAVVDFLNDSNYERIAWEEPPAGLTFFVEKGIRLYYGDLDPVGHLILRGENCLQEGAVRLAAEGGGIGKATIRAQLYHLSKVQPEHVVTG